MSDKILSTGVEIPDEGVPTWDGRMQYTTRMEKRPESIDDEAAYLKWKWRMNLANPSTGLDNDALIAGVKRIVAEAQPPLSRGAGPSCPASELVSIFFPHVQIIA